jgi:hypothetical protein
VITPRLQGLPNHAVHAGKIVVAAGYVTRLVVQDTVDHVRPHAILA